ncbi:IspD/TarI family cytidylyltransferase [Mucisphaera sp.]|uniref:IspD/TarI family cytidylyltransferase n=1 Tax=Mucisphaera sp. TaxID=2913024 RepID=UPI003D0EB0AF
MRLGLILLAAGRGTRFGRSKVDLPILGRPVIAHALDCFAGVAGLEQRLVVVAPDDVEAARERWAEVLEASGAQVCAGGLEDRWASVVAALEALDEGITHVLIHDAARPCVSTETVGRVVSALGQDGAVIPGVAVSSTLKRVGDAVREGVRVMGEGVERDGLIEVQTPQGFEVALLRRGFVGVLEDLRSGRAHVTDDASVVERLGERVVVVEGDTGNVKITRPGDELVAEAILRARGVE